MVKIQKYDLETNEFAVAERLKWEKMATEGEFPENQENIGKNCEVINIPKYQKVISYFAEIVYENNSRKLR